MKGLPLDEAGPVRPGEELDGLRLETWLRQRLPDLEGPLEILQFPGGHSNLTYLLRFGTRELVLRRPPFGAQVKTAHDMGREYRVLSRLPDLYPKAPRALAYCEDPGVIDAPFYVAKRIRGVILRHQRLPSGVEIPPEELRRLSKALVDGLAELHAVDYRGVGLADLGRPQGYVERQIRGWSERWQRARTDDVAEMDRAAWWLAAHLPGDQAPAFIHNDYKYDNLVLDQEDPTRIVGVLDWEMATVGDPLMDLGTTLGYWVDPDDPPDLKLLPTGPTALPGNLSRREIAECYAARSGRDLSNILFYYVYGLFKIAVIAQQIYYRYRHGFTRDERFASLIEGVRILGRTAALAIESERIDGLGE